MTARSRVRPNANRGTVGVSALVVIALVLFAGCAGLGRQNAETVTVEGEVTAQGQEPFAEYVLETEEGHFYVVDFDGQAGADFSTPARLRVTGRLSTTMWDGSPFPHIEVAEWERAP